MKMILCKQDPSRVLRGQNPDILAKANSMNKITFKIILKEGTDFVFILWGGGGKKFSLFRSCPLIRQTYIDMSLSLLVEINNVINMYIMLFQCFIMEYPGR